MLDSNLLAGQMSRLVANEASGPLASVCTRTLKPSQRQKVIMTRSVDHQDQRSFIGSQGQSSIFGSKAGGVVTARMHLNKNTTLELMETPQKIIERKHISPFANRAARRQLVEERGAKIQEKILQEYGVDPFHPPPLKTAVPSGRLLTDEQASSSRRQSCTRL